MLPADVTRPGYDRRSQRRGIVHLGIGAFHRAHQAVYTDLAMDAGDRDWAITGVSLRSDSVQRQLAPQDGLYTLTVRGGDTTGVRLIGAVTDLIAASTAPARPAAALASPDTRIVTLTVTEKGYARPACEAAADTGSIYAHLARAVVDRHAAGLAPLTLVSCDNLADNGRILREGVADRLDRVSPQHRRWFEDSWACPATMVDRIVPATTPAGLDETEDRIGLRDEGAVITEPYSQWMIEDRFAGPRPRWEIGGAQVVGDVRPFGMAKLRMLNGAHSALAYLGIARGCEFVHEAIADPSIRAVVERLMRTEAAASIAGPAQDLDGYADRMIARFANAALPHRLAQIAMDGSQKIGPRWLDAIAANRLRGRGSPATLRAIAAWLAYVGEQGSTVADPMAHDLTALWAKAGAAGIVDAVFAPGGLLSSRSPLSETDRAVVSRALRKTAGGQP